MGSAPSILNAVHLGTFTGHTAGVYDAALVGTGLLISAADDCTLVMWNMQEGKGVHTLRGHTHYVRCVTRLGNGKIVSGSGDHTLKIWDAKAPYACLGTLEGHSDGIECIAVLGETLAVSGSRDHTLKLWSIESQTCLATFKGHTDWVKAVKWVAWGASMAKFLSSRASTIVSASEDRTLRVWDVSQQLCLRILSGHGAGVCDVVSVGGGRVVSASLDATLKLWDIVPMSHDDHGCLHTFEGHKGAVCCVTRVNSTCIVSSGEDKTMRVWDLDSKQCLECCKTTHQATISRIVNCASYGVVTTSLDNTLRQWLLQTTCAKIPSPVLPRSPVDSPVPLSPTEEKTIPYQDSSSGPMTVAMLNELLPRIVDEAMRYQDCSDASSVNNWRLPDFFHDFQSLTLLSERPVAWGHFADVYKARLRGQAAPVAAKKLRMRGIPRTMMQDVVYEALLMRQLDASKVVKLHGVVFSDPNYFILTEFMEGKDLARHVHGCRLLEASVRCRLALQIAEAIAHLHASKIVHGDVKCLNVLVDTETLTPDSTVKLCDFGLSRVITESLRSSSKAHEDDAIEGPKGSLMWMAPEQLRPDANARQRRSSRATDVWAFGILLVELETCDVPYPTRDGWSKASIDTHIRHGGYPQYPSDGPLAGIIAKCLTEVSSRPQMEHLVGPLKDILRGCEGKQ